MREKIRTILAILAAIMLILAIYIYIKNSSQKQIEIPNDQNENKDTPLFPVPDKNEEKFTIKTSEGSVDIQNIYKNSLDTLSGEGVAFKDTDEYYIAYYPEDQGFLIVIMNSDINRARQNAEKEFVNTLGITNDQACKLKVSLTVPISVNKEAAGGNYGLSFCSNGKSFSE